MTWDHAVKLVDSLAWPLIAAVLVIILGPVIRQFLREAKTVSFSGAGFEASANRDEVAAAAAQSSVLWVDDRPENNLYERRALEALGIHIDLANDSQEALRKLSSKEYDLVISDMARPSCLTSGL